MTISTTTIKNSYSGDGSTTAFNYTFKITDQDDIDVIIRSSDGTETTKTITTHYTVSGVGNANGGTVTFTSGNIPAATETVVLRRDTPQTQGTDLIENDPLPANTLEDAFDKLTSISQELQEESDRSIKLSRTNTMTSTEFTVDATNRANKILAFDGNGEISVTQELGTFRGNWSASTSYAARDIVKDTSTNNIFIANTAHTSSGSQPLTSNTDSAKWDLLVDAASASSSASAAATSATNAATSETNAATSATNASNSATSAASSATTATTKASEASTSATAAQTAQTAAEAALDTFDDKFLGSKASDPTLDNDGNALTDGALYFNTTDDVMKVYDLGNTQWKQLTPTTSQQTNIDTVAAADSNITAVAGQITPTNNLATVAGDSTNIGLVGGSIANVNLVGGSIGNVNEVGNNMGTVNEFGERYRVSATAPTTSLDVGDLYYDTTADQMKVYGSSGWQNAGSSVNGTSERFTYTISGTPTTVTGNDDAGNNLTYDANFIDVYLNGVKQVNGTDVTVTSGSSVVFASALTNGDIVDIVTFGTFNVAQVAASAITSGTISNDRMPTPTLIVKGDGASADGQIQLNCSQNSHGVKIKSPAHSAGQSYTLILPTSVGTNGQVLATNGSSTNQLSWIDAAETKPTITSTSFTIAPSTSTTITIAGTNFVSIPIVEFIKSDTGAITRATAVAFTSSTSINATTSLANGTYFIRIENNDGNAVRSSSAILSVSTAPSFTTAAGSLGTIAGDFSGTVATLVGSSDSTIAFSEVTSGGNVLTASSGANCSLNSATGAITTTDFGGTSTTPTTYTFDIRITDQEGQTTDRQFSLTSSFGATGGGQFN